MRWVILAIWASALVGCDVVLPGTFGTGSQPVSDETLIETPVAPGGQDGVEDASDADGEFAPLAPDPEVSTGTLGRTVASLGNAAEPGLWLKTPLVSVEQPGRVYFPDTNTTVDVTLIPIDGPETAGSRLSLAAMQALGAPLTGLPEVDVFAG
ncbi:MAG: hypothetical protein AAFQ58_10405 [Pseudomonadota bacterium]